MTKNNKTLLLVIWIELLFSLFWYLFCTNHLYLNLEATYRILGGDVLSYPALGYPVFLLPAVVLGIHVPAWAFYIQLSLCVFGILAWLRMFRIEPSPRIAFGILPFIAVIALEQAATLPVFLFLICLKLMREDKIWLSAILLGLCVLFRTELLLLFLPAIMSVGISDARKFIVTGMASAAVLLVLSGSVFGSNSSGVLYGSLGQLPRNPWGLTMDDSCITRVANEHGVQDPWSPEGSRLLRTLWWKAVNEHPIAFAEKFVVNSYRAFLSGPYIGEWRAYEWGKPIKYSLHIVFGLTMLWCYFRWRLIVNLEGGSFVLGCALLLILSQGFGHQMVRHMSIVYLPLLGLVDEADRGFWNNTVTDSMNI
jgi:hypothetical protein